MRSGLNANVEALSDLILFHALGRASGRNSGLDFDICSGFLEKSFDLCLPAYVKQLTFSASVPF